MHPELKQALDAGVSMPEVIELFRKYHRGRMEKQIDASTSWPRKTHRECEFWDTSRPLLCRLPELFVFKSKVIDEALLSIHKVLTREVISWLCDSKRKSNVYLIAEPRVPGLYTRQDSRATVLADICSDAQRFGQYFPSRMSPSPTYDIYSLVTGLAVSYPPFRHALTRIMIDDPEIFGLPVRTRFKKLIHEPWSALRESHPHYAITPPVIVLRFDSERHDKELFRSICEFGLLRRSSPLLWIISVCPSFIHSIQDLLDSPVPFRYYRVPICYKEGPADTALILHYKFTAFRHKYREMFDDSEAWPSEEQMSKLITIVSGVFEFVDIIIQFIDWMDDGGPRAHLETFLAYMLDSPSPSEDRRYSALDHFYIRALSDIPPDLLLIMKKAFGIIRCFGYHALGLFDLICLLSLRNDALHPHLLRLASVGTNERYFSSPFFKHFLEDPIRSGQFYTPKSESRLYAFQACLDILGRSSYLNTLLKPQAVRWIQADQKTYLMGTEYYRSFACSKLFDIRDASVEWIPLQRFDFRCLAYACKHIVQGNFVQFLGWLHAWDKSSQVNIVRVEPRGPLDRRFIDACRGLVEPMDFEEKEAQFPPEPNGRAFLADGFSGVRIYTAAMLDYM